MESAIRDLMKQRADLLRRLAGLYQVGNQEALFENPTRPQSGGVRITSSYRLTTFGRAFMGACA
jgi:hypothetical protein